MYQHVIMNFGQRRNKKSKKQSVNRLYRYFFILLGHNALKSKGNCPLQIHFDRSGRRAQLTASRKWDVKHTKRQVNKICSKCSKQKQCHSHTIFDKDVTNNCK